MPVIHIHKSAPGRAAEQILIPERTQRPDLRRVRRAERGGRYKAVAAAAGDSLRSVPSEPYGKHLAAELIERRTAFIIERNPYVPVKTGKLCGQRGRIPFLQLNGDPVPIFLVFIGVIKPVNCFDDGFPVAYFQYHFRDVSRLFIDKQVDVFRFAGPFESDSGGIAVQPGRKHLAGVLCALGDTQRIRSVLTRVSDGFLIIGPAAHGPFGQPRMEKNVTDNRVAPTFRPFDKRRFAQVAIIRARPVAPPVESGIERKVAAGSFRIPPGAINITENIVMNRPRIRRGAWRIDHDCFVNKSANKDSVGYACVVFGYGIVGNPGAVRPVSDQYADMAIQQSIAGYDGARRHKVRP